MTIFEANIYHRRTYSSISPFEPWSPWSRVIWHYAVRFFRRFTFSMSNLINHIVQWLLNINRIRCEKHCNNRFMRGGARYIAPYRSLFFFLSLFLSVCFFLWSCFDWCHFCCRSHWHFSGYMCCFCQLLVGRSLLAKCRTFSTKMTHRSKNNSMKSICWKWHTHSKKHNERKKRRQKQHTFTLTLLHVTHHVIFIRSYRSQFLIYSFAAWFVLWCRNVNRELFVMLSCSRVFT